MRWALSLCFLAGCVQADIDANGIYICRDSDDCAPGKTCAHNRCYDDPPPCSPYDSAGCPAGQRCGRFTDGLGGPVFLECGPAGPGGPGAACELPSECAPGLECIRTSFADGSSVRECLELCRGEDDCSPGFDCVSELDEEPDHRQWGRIPITVCDRTL